MLEQVYDDNFYINRNADTEYAAEKILGLLFKRLQRDTNSIIDVGCGVGTWLRVAHAKYNVEKIIGLDGEYVPHHYLQIKKNEFIPVNLEDYCVNEILKKIGGKKYDVAICLEVAEHIRKKNADIFIRKLCELSDIVLFSAAIPQQGGNAHVNEQRLSFWVNLFRKNDFQIYDVIRAEIWNDKKVPVWYRNNIVMFCERKVGSTLVDMTNTFSVTDIVHPDMFETKIRQYERQKRELQKNINIKRLLEGEVCKIVKKLKSFR